MDTPKFYETTEYSAKKAEYKAVEAELKEQQSRYDHTDKHYPDQSIRRSIRKDIARLQNQLDRIGAEMSKLPQPLYSSTWIKQNIIDSCDQEIRAFEEMKAKFLERFAIDPADTISWLSADMVGSQEFYKHAIRIKQYALAHTYQDTYNYLINYQTSIQNAVIQQANSFSYSTSVSSNMVDKFQMAAKARMLGEFPSFDPFRYTRFVDQTNIHYDDAQPVEIEIGQ